MTHTPIQKYHYPNYVNKNDWADLKGEFEDLVKHGWNQQPMFDLLEYISNESIGQRIYGTASINNLKLTIYDTGGYAKETLSIVFDGQHEKWKFTYYSVPFEKRPFYREYPKELGIEKFDQIIKWLRW